MFKQLFDTKSSTLTYLLAAEDGSAVIIDPVKEHTEYYIALCKQLNIKLLYSLETHVHADHITASAGLRSTLGLQTGVGESCEATSANLQLNDGDVIVFGSEKITVIATPGHTLGSVSYYWRDRVFTGDALLINGCGRTDFQGGDAGTLYDSITNKLFALPDETLVYPAHDYQGRRVSAIIQEKNINPRVAHKSKAEFIDIMQNLNLPKPAMMDVAVPLNRKCGLDETDQDVSQQA